MLRESSRVEGNEVDLGAITTGNDVQSGVPAGEELVEFAEAGLGDNIEHIARARSQLEDVVGTEGMVDAAGVIANFQRMVRIADGTGIPLDDPVLMLTTNERETFGINRFSSAKNTQQMGIVKRFLGAILRKLAPLFFDRATK